MVLESHHLRSEPRLTLSIVTFHLLSFPSTRKQMIKFGEIFKTGPENVKGPSTFWNKTYDLKNTNVKI